ncbi:hypothetical protein [Photorhabdus cinerea]|uniref:Uncharacterized protein n=1 Tax=Photorhabdus cinerea TaxID=471575 RepID=A0A7X5TJ28_9GAMM|nr:hypothetical protein [Photorhabdus cinerea]NHB94550.1 hypothetical protein [Photorhabdus cinerea]
MMAVNNYENYEVALSATETLINAIPLLGGSNRRDDYEQALEIVERLIDTDDENPLIDLGVRLENGKYPTLSLFFVQIDIN